MSATAARESGRSRATIHDGLLRLIDCTRAAQDRAAARLNAEAR
ncbi:MAG: hypothetical protein WCF33_02780 [Pseudonocardiaceae bacterium]